MVQRLQAPGTGSRFPQTGRNPLGSQQWGQIQGCRGCRGHYGERLKRNASWLAPGSGVWWASKLHKDSKVNSSQVPENAVVMHNPELIFQPGERDSWDEGGVGGAVVSCFIGDNEERWFMWYSGRRCEEEDPIYSILPGAGSMGENVDLAISFESVPGGQSTKRSLTLVSTWLGWSKFTSRQSNALKDSLKGCTMEANKDWWTFDTYYLVPSDVQILSSGSVGSGAGVYWMFYCGGAYGEIAAPPGLPGVPQGTSIKGLKARPGLAMSQNGFNWARIEGPHYTGAIFDEEDDAMDWDSLFVACPQVINAGPRDLRMYYHTFNVETQRYTTGLARSKDGFEWIKFGPLLSGGSDSDFDCKGVAAQCVVRDVENKQFVMFYEGVDKDNVRSIGLAISEDGITEWKRYPHPILTKSAEGSWDCGSVGSPWAVSMAGSRWRLYFGGKEDANGGWKGVGLALSAPDGKIFEGFPVDFKRRTSRSINLS